MIYFTSDLHFGHEKIISFCNRPFGCVKEMDDTLIANWNATVTKNDVVYILGDFAFYKEQDKIEELWNSLNGIKHWIIGNHDNNGQLNNLYKLGRIFKPKSYDELKYNKRKFILFHYPLEFWNKGYYGSIHLHGHTHNSKPLTKKNRVDVGVDAWNYKPVSIDEIITFVDKTNASPNV